MADAPKDHNDDTSEGGHSGPLKVTVECQAEILPVGRRKPLNRRPRKPGLNGRPERLSKGLTEFAKLRFKSGQVRVDSENKELSDAEKDGLSVGFFFHSVRNLTGRE